MARVAENDIALAIEGETYRRDQAGNEAGPGSIAGELKDRATGKVGLIEIARGAVGVDGKENTC